MVPEDWHMLPIVQNFTVGDGGYPTDKVIKNSDDSLELWCHCSSFLQRGVFAMEYPA